MRKYQLEPSTQRPGYWVLTDTENNIVINFQEGAFNDTQKITILDDDFMEGKTANDVAHIMQEMGQWMADHHADKAFPLHTFMMMKEEESGKIYIKRTKSPRWRLVIDEPCSTDEMISSLKKLIEYLRKR